MDDETNSLIARWYMSRKNYGNVVSRDFSDWAVARLERNIESKNIGILASMFNVDSLSEIEDYFHRCLKDLDWDFPNKSACIERYGEFVARGILNKTIEIDTACGIMHDIFYSCDNPNRFSEWATMVWLKEEMTELDYEVAVSKEAENFLRNGKIKYSPNIEEKPTFSELTSQKTFLERLRRLFHISADE